MLPILCFSFNAENSQSTTSTRHTHCQLSLSLPSTLFHNSHHLLFVETIPYHHLIRITVHLTGGSFSSTSDSQPTTTKANRRLTSNSHPSAIFTRDSFSSSSPSSSVPPTVVLIHIHSGCFTWGSFGWIFCSSVPFFLLESPFTPPVTSRSK